MGAQEKLDQQERTLRYEDARMRGCNKLARQYILGTSTIDWVLSEFVTEDLVHCVILFKGMSMVMVMVMMINVYYGCWHSRTAIVVRPSVVQGSEECKMIGQNPLELPASVAPGLGAP